MHLDEILVKIFSCTLSVPVQGLPIIKFYSVGFIKFQYELKCFIVLQHLRR